MGDLLRSEYPGLHIMEQYPIKVTARKTLYLDYYIPSARMAFETDGRQHQQYVSHFHESRYDFENGQRNDREKQAWCDDNNVTLIRFSHLDPLDEQTLRKKILIHLGSS